MFFLPFIYENLSAVQIDCTERHYLCSVINKNVYEQIRFFNFKNPRPL